MSGARRGSGPPRTGTDAVPYLASSLFHNMSSPPRTTTASVQRPVWGPATLFSLGHALAAHGLLPLRAEDAGPPLGSPDLADLARRRWKDHIRSLLDDAAACGALDRARLAALEDGGAPAGMLIGWRPAPADEARVDLAPCTDLALTIAVLERRVGELYLSSRHPDRSWRQLFAQTLAVDDPRFRGTQRRPTP